MATTRALATLEKVMEVPELTIEVATDLTLNSDAQGRRRKRKAAARSKVTNGQILPGVDSRSLIARRYFDIMSAILVDQGGADRCSGSRLQLVRRFAAAAVLAENMEAELANGKTIDIAQHAQLCSSLVRLASKIGINRVAKNADELTLSDIVRLDLLETQRAKAAAASTTIEVVDGQES